MYVEDIVKRSVGQIRGRLLRRSSRAVGRASFASERSGSVVRNLTTWAYSDLRNQGNSRWRRDIRRATLDWVGLECTFDEGRERFAQALLTSRGEDLSTRELLALRNLVGTLGFFTLTEDLLTRAISRAVEDFDQAPNVWSARNAFTARLLLGDLEKAVYPFEYCLGRGTFTDPDLVKRFLEMCVSPATGEESVRGTTVVGPGPVGKPGLQIDPSWPVCRVVMPGVTSWGSDDVARGQADFAYLNGDSTEWLSSLTPSERDHLVASFLGVRIKKETSWESEYETVAQVRRMKDLFLTGEPNMVPTIILDQLMSGSSLLYVTGTSFFVGSEPYRSTERRHFHDIDLASDRYGAVYQGSFERCYSHASHDQIVNRGIIRLLFDAGKVVGDEVFTKALTMSQTEYLRELENSYGRGRR